VVGDVVADQGIEQVALVVQVRLGENDALSVPDRDGPFARIYEVGRVLRQQRCGHQDRRILRSHGGREHLAGCGGGAADQAKQQGGGVRPRRGHIPTVAEVADDRLTPG